MNKTLIIVLAVVVLMLALGNPYSLQWPLKCPLYWLTGLQCPLCGMQRMLHELLHLNLMKAWQLNAGLMLCLPYITIMMLGQVYAPAMQWRFVRWCYTDRVIFTISALMIMWGVTRNLV